MDRWSDQSFDDQGCFTRGSAIGERADRMRFFNGESVKPGVSEWAGGLFAEWSSLDQKPFSLSESNKSLRTRK